MRLSVWLIEFIKLLGGKRLHPLKSLTGVPASLRPRKQRVGLAHEPIGNEADPFLCGPVEDV
jgi:hypothetical protein